LENYHAHGPDIGFGADISSDFEHLRTHVWQRASIVHLSFFLPLRNAKVTQLYATVFFDKNIGWF